VTEHTAPLPDGFDSTSFQHGFSTHWFDVDRDPDGHFVEVVHGAIDAGYRRIDCNPVWDTEAMVGAAIGESSTPRDELFVTTVVPFDRLGEKPARRCVLSSLDRLGLDRVDAVFVSAPISGWDIEGTAAALESLVGDGVVAHVGARYMSLADISTFGDRLAVPVFAHLTELHPLWPATEMRTHAIENGYWIVADSPFMQGVVGEIGEIRRTAERLGTTPYQVTLAWLHQINNTATSTWVHSPELMAENLRAGRIELDRQAVDEIAAITRRWSGVPHLHPVSAS
jgi:2,5-diketo-D-gluconate reductase B